MEVRQDESLSSSEPEGDRQWGTTHPERWCFCSHVLCTAFPCSMDSLKSIKISHTPPPPHLSLHTNSLLLASATFLDFLYNHSHSLTWTICTIPHHLSECIDILFQELCSHCDIYSSIPTWLPAFCTFT